MYGLSVAKLETEEVQTYSYPSAELCGHSHLLQLISESSIKEYKSWVNLHKRTLTGMRTGHFCFGHSLSLSCMGREEVPRVVPVCGPARGRA